MMSRTKILTGAAHRVALFCWLALLAAPLMLPGSTVSAKPRLDKLWLETAGGAREIAIEVAETPEDAATGLMFRTALADTAGMLFPYPAPQEGNMWMRNTYIPLDMVFIRSDGVIHRIHANAQPLSEDIISSEGEVLAVLELAGGAAARFGLKAGDKVRHPMFQGGR